MVSHHWILRNMDINYSDPSLYSEFHLVEYFQEPEEQDQSPLDDDHPAL